MSGKRTFTPEQRAEVARLALEQDLSAEQIAEQASAVGIGRLPRFEISASTVRGVVAEARRMAPEPEVSAANELAGGVVTILQAEVEQLKQQQAEGNLDLDRVRQVVVCIERLAKARDYRRPVRSDDDEAVTPGMDKLRSTFERELSAREVGAPAA